MEIKDPTNLKRLRAFKYSRDSWVSFLHNSGYYLIQLSFHSVPLITVAMQRYKPKPPFFFLLYPSLRRNGMASNEPHGNVPKRKSSRIQCHHAVCVKSSKFKYWSHSQHKVQTSEIQHVRPIPYCSFAARGSSKMVGTVQYIFRKCAPNCISLYFDCFQIQDIHYEIKDKKLILKKYVFNISNIQLFKSYIFFNKFFLFFYFSIS